jgi:nitrogen fixation negative regulator NifL
MNSSDNFTFLAQVVEQIEDLVMITDLEGGIVYVNPAFEKVTGYSREELVGRKSNILKSGKHGQRFYEDLWRTILAGNPFRNQLINKRKDGSLFYSEKTITPIRGDSGNISHFVSTDKDITDQKTAEKGFKTIFDLSPVGIILCNENGIIEKTNSAFSLFTGKEQARGIRIESLVVEEEQKEMAEFHRKLIVEGLLKSHEFQLKTARAQRWVQVDCSLIREFCNNTRSGLYIFSDISLQKEVELQLNRKAERLTDSNQKLEEFASLASHDLRAPARIMGAYLSLLDKEYGHSLDNRGTELLKVALVESLRMRDIVNDLLEFSHVCYTTPSMKLLSMSKIMRDTLAIIEPEIRDKRAEIIYEPLPEIQGNEIQLRRLFENLLSNALKYNRRRPKIAVSASQTNQEHIISIADNGIGIPSDEIPLLFEIFHRGAARNEFPGTGIGLASCKKIVENHHGRIWVSSTPDKGSIFYLSFPKNDAIGH